MAAKRWAFFSYGHNLGDFTRAAETARAMMRTGSAVEFFNHGSVHLSKIADYGISCTPLQPELTWEQHETIMDINRYKAPVGTPMPVDKQQWISMAEADIEALETFRPDGVYAGLSLSCMISVPYLRLPMVTQVPTVNCPAFIENEMYDMPNTMERNFITRYVIPSWLKRKIMKRVLLGDAARHSLSSFNEARKYFGLSPITNIVDLVRGDLTILPDLPELSGLPASKLSPGYRYSAPIFAMPTIPVPDDVHRVFSRKGIKVFCSMGSSGFPESLRLVVASLRTRPDINLVVASTTIVPASEFGPSTDNFFASPFLPAHAVNEMADIAILHGGQGTIQTAVWAGTPVVGIGFQAEQQANINGIARAGMARRIPIYELSHKRLMRELDEVQKPSYRASAKYLQELVRKTDGAMLSAQLMNEFLG